MKQICAIRDAKAEYWMEPLYFQAVGQALRAFEDAINKDGTELNAHPEDYTMFHLGTFDETTGEITTLEQPYQLEVGVNVVRVPENTPPLKVQA